MKNDKPIVGERPDFGVPENLAGDGEKNAFLRGFLEIAKALKPHPDDDPEVQKQRVLDELGKEAEEVQKILDDVAARRISWAEKDRRMAALSEASKARFFGLHGIPYGKQMNSNPYARKPE